MDGVGQGPIRSTGGRSGRRVQGVRQCRDPRYRCSFVLGGPETGGGGTGYPDQPTDPGKGGIVDLTLEDRTEPQAQRVEDSKSP